MVTRKPKSKVYSDYCCFIELSIIFITKIEMFMNNVKDLLCLRLGTYPPSHKKATFHGLEFINSIKINRKHLIG